MTDSSFHSLQVDGLLQQLCNSGVGCYTGKVYVGALAYADDVASLAPTPSSMRRLLKICEEYGAEFSVTFNASKSAWMYSTKHERPLSSDVHFCVDDKYIPYVTQYLHLGHVISADTNDKQDILNRRNAVCGKLNYLLCHFWKCDPFVKSKLLRNFCCDFYGSCLWDLSQSHIADLTVAWHKGLR